MPNWYIAAHNLTAVNVKATEGEGLKFVGKFDTKEKWKRSENDMYNPFTPAERLERMMVEEKKPKPGSIIPTPVEIKVENEQYINISDWVIVSAATFMNEAKYLAGKLNLPEQNDTGIVTKNLRLLQQDVDVKIDGKSSKSIERYNIEMKHDVITISAPESTGIFYGIQTLLAVTKAKSKQVLMVS